MTTLEILILVWLIAGIIGFYAQKYTTSELEKHSNSELKKPINYASNFKKLREGMNKK